MRGFFIPYKMRNKKVATKTQKYSDLLKDPRWQKKRLEIFNRDDWKCQLCMSNKNTLHIHHKQYQQGNKPWEYDNSWLITLCNDCHNKFHTKYKPKKNIIPTWFGFREWTYEYFEDMGYDLFIESYRHFEINPTITGFLNEMNQYSDDYKNTPVFKGLIQLVELYKRQLND